MVQYAALQGPDPTAAEGGQDKAFLHRRAAAVAVRGTEHGTARRDRRVRRDRLGQNGLRRILFTLGSGKRHSLPADTPLTL
jgi:hypothetical protein